METIKLEPGQVIPERREAVCGCGQLHIISHGLTGGEDRCKSCGELVSLDTYVDPVAEATKVEDSRQFRRDTTRSLYVPAEQALQFLAETGDATAALERFREVCRMCYGSGKVRQNGEGPDGTTCPDCGGRGRVGTPATE
jgi:hypothetical protein